MNEEIETEETTATESTSNEGNEQSSGGELEQTEASQSQGKSTDNTVPYSRFKEVNDQLRTFKENQQNAVNSLTGGVKQPEETNLEPKPEQFQNNADYYRALGVYGGQQGFQEAKTQEEQQNRANTEHQSNVDADNNFSVKTAEAQKKYTNYDEMVAQSTAVFSLEAQKAIKTSPVAGDLMYALASNPEKANEISNMNPNEAIYALGMLSAQIPGSNGQPVKMSNMPNPISTVGTGKPSGVRPYSDDMSQDSFNDSFPMSDLE